MNVQAEFILTEFFLQDKLSPVPFIKSVDPVDREIDYMPTKAPYDPRWMLAGRQNPSMYSTNCDGECSFQSHNAICIEVFQFCSVMNVVLFLILIVTTHFQAFV
jgi:hypothetical protein